MHKKKKIWITKSSGNQEKFSKAKLRRSLKKSGANEKKIQEIISAIEQILYPGISTRIIYKKAFSLLRKSSRPLAAKYKLKKALMEIGPSGYPFEKYVAALLLHKGYKVKVGKILKGTCVNHEVDVFAEKNNQVILVECKFHSDEYNITGVKIPLYIHSRYLDIKSNWKKTYGSKQLDPARIITNTRFSKDAQKYSRCIGLHLIGWNYPKKASLKELIDTNALHPITCLTSITNREKKELVGKNIILCKTLCKNPNALTSIGLNDVRRKKIIAEAKALCAS